MLSEPLFIFCNKMNKVFVESRTVISRLGEGTIFKIEFPEKIVEEREVIK